MIESSRRFNCQSTHICIQQCVNHPYFFIRSSSRIFLQSSSVGGGASVFAIPITSSNDIVCGGVEFARGPRSLKSDAPSQCAFLAPKLSRDSTLQISLSNSWISLIFGVPRLPSGREETPPPFFLFRIYENTGGTHTAADTHRYHAISVILPTHFINQAHSEFCACATERMSKSDCATVDVHLFGG